jgi:hypothetical protein
LGDGFAAHRVIDQIVTGHGVTATATSSQYRQAKKRKRKG